MSSADTTLTVAWRAGATVAAGPIDISGDVADEFSALVAAAEPVFSTIGSIPAYEPDTEYEDPRTLVLAQLRDVVDAELIEVLRVGYLNAHVTKDDVNARRPHLYSIGVHRGDEVWQFVRATSPVKFPTKTIRGFLTDSFDRLTEPILVFDDYFDFIIRSSDIVVLNPTQFERITNSPAAAVAASCTDPDRC